MLIRTKSGSHICELYNLSTTFNSVLVQSVLLLEETLLLVEKSDISKFTDTLYHIRELTYHIGDVIASIIASSVVDCGLEPLSGQPRDLQNGIFCFYVKHTALRTTIKRWLVWNQSNVSKWSDMFTRGLLFQ